eukprot:gene13629-biopygen21582
MPHPIGGDPWVGPREGGGGGGRRRRAAAADGDG